MNNIMTILPLAIIMIAGPQIISAIILATSERAKKNSFSFLFGVLVAIVLGVSIFYFTAGLFSQSGTSSDNTQLQRIIDYASIALLAYLAYYVYKKRTNTEPPKWMNKLQTATPQLAMKLGLLLFLIMPTDIITMFTVGSWLARNNAPLVQSIPFIALTMLLIGFPLILLLLMGKKAKVILPKVREWMSTNSWVVNEIVIIFFLVMTISSLE